ncbi:hypothetical protein D3C81_1518620 [compost metagenome]
MIRLALADDEPRSGSEHTTEPVQYLGDLGSRCIVGSKEPCRLRQPQPKKRKQYQRHDATREQYCMPPIRRDQPGSQKTAKPGTHVEACEHDGDEKRAIPLWQVFRQQSGGVRQRCTQGYPGEQTQQAQLVGVAGKGAGQAQHTEPSHGDQQHPLATQAVSVRARCQSANRKAYHAGAHDRAKSRAGKAPLLNQ